MGLPDRWSLETGSVTLKGSVKMFFQDRWSGDRFNYAENIGAAGHVVSDESGLSKQVVM